MDNSSIERAKKEVCPAARLWKRRAAACLLLTGAVLLIPAAADAISLQPGTPVSSASFTVPGGFSDSLPTSLSAGHWNADNLSDVLMCSSANNSCWLFFGRAVIQDGTMLRDADVTFVGIYAGWGTGAAFVGDINGDGLEDIAVGAPYSTLPTGPAYTGSVWIFFGRGDGFRGTIGYYDANVTIWGMAANGDFGAGVARAGDVNRDGIADFWVGAPDVAQVAPAGGAAYLFLGSRYWSTNVSASISVLRVHGATYLALVGYVITGDVDLNRDGYADVLFGSPNARDSGGYTIGAAFAFLGPFPTDGRNVNTTTANVTFWGSRMIPTVGASVAAVDNFTLGGGMAILIGVPGYPSSSPDGAVYVFRITDWTCCQSVYTWDAVGLLIAKDGYDQAGTAMAAGGDIDGDGVGDLVVGAPAADGKVRSDIGRSLIVYGRQVGAQPFYLNNSTAWIDGVSNYARVGSLMTLADINGDGKADIILGGPPDQTYGASAGAVYAFMGRPRNRPPEVNISVEGTMEEGATIVFRLLLDDPDGDLVTWGWDFSGSGTFSSNKDVLVVARIYSDNGVFGVGVQAFDGALYATDYTSFSIANVPPGCSLAVVNEFIEGRIGSVRLTTFDAGRADQLFTSWGGPADMTVEDNIAIYVPRRGGNLTFNVTVRDDDFGLGWCDLNVTVRNIPPKLVLTGTTQFYEGEVGYFRVNITDPGADDYGHFQIAWEYPGFSGTPSGETLLWSSTRAGYFTITVRVGDLDGAIVSTGMTVQVISRPPDVALLVTRTATEGQSMSLSVLQYSGAGFDTLDVSWRVCHPGVPRGLTYSIDKAYPGEHCVTVVVTDDDGDSVTLTDSFVVRNRDPLSGIRTVGTPPFAEGQKIRFDAVWGAWETSGALNYSWYLDGELAGLSSSYTFVGRAGAHAVRLIARDADGGVSDFNATITVQNLPPEVMILGNTTVKLYESDTWSSLASDPSGVTPRLIWEVDGLVVGHDASLTWSWGTPGQHTIRLTADDGAGSYTTVSLVVQVEAPPEYRAGPSLGDITGPLGSVALWVGVLLFFAGLAIGTLFLGRRLRRL